MDTDFLTQRRKGAESQLFEKNDTDEPSCSGSFHSIAELGRFARRVYHAIFAEMDVFTCSRWCDIHGKGANVIRKALSPSGNWMRVSYPHLGRSFVNFWIQVFVESRCQNLITLMHDEPRWGIIAAKLLSDFVVTRHVERML